MYMAPMVEYITITWFEMATNDFDINCIQINDN